MTSASSWSAGMARSSARLAAPTDCAKFTPACSFSASDFIIRASGGLVKNAPLWPIPLWTMWRESGDIISALTDAEPADSPLIVTLPGSPPKASMLSWTHRSAATWSSMP